MIHGASSSKAVIPSGFRWKTVNGCVVETVISVTSGVRSTNSQAIEGWDPIKVMHEGIHIHRRRMVNGVSAF